MAELRGRLFGLNKAIFPHIEDGKPIIRNFFQFFIRIVGFIFLLFFLDFCAKRIYIIYTSYTRFTHGKEKVMEQASLLIKIPVLKSQMELQELQEEMEQMAMALLPSLKQQQWALWTLTRSPLLMARRPLSM